MTEMAPVAIYAYDLSRGCLIFANAEYERQLGYAFDELQQMGDRMPSIIYHPDEHERLRSSRFELHENQDGSTAWAVIRESVITRKPDGSPERIIGIGIDITRRKEAEDTIEALLREKELLLTEVHHRVKNNMLSVSSLLSLQAGAAGSAEAAAALTEAEGRMQSMAVLYDRLYRSDNLREMPIGEYLGPLVREILATQSRAESVSLEIEICDATLPVSLLAGIGMVVNEAVSNAIKHAFAGRAVGRIAVSAVRAEDRLEITVADDGVGLPDDVDLGESDGFGLKLIQSLASQHGLQVRLERNGGTRFVIGVDGGY